MGGSGLVFRHFSERLDRYHFLENCVSSELKKPLKLKNDGGHVSNSITSVAACPKVPITTAPPATTAAPGTGSTDATTESSTDFMCQDILQMVEIKDQWNCRSCSRARIYGSMQGITSDHIMTMTFDKEIDFNQLCF